MICIRSSYGTSYPLLRGVLYFKGPFPKISLPFPPLQMLKHGRAGVPMEVMGLMLGEFVDDYTVTVIDVFAMPQSGTVRTSDTSE